MRIIKFTENWNNYDSDNYICLDEDKVVYSYSIIRFHDKKDEMKLEGLYVQPEYRKQGYFKKIMKEVLDINFTKLFIEVYIGDTIIKKYEELGFEFYADHNDEFEWMVYDKNI